MGDEADYVVNKMQDGKMPVSKTPEVLDKKVDVMSTEIMPIETSLSVRFTDKAIEDLKIQRQQLVKFVKSQMRKDVDYGVIPGVKKPSLFKPGAEKLANLFQLGSRIVDGTRQIDIKNNFAMFSQKIEIYHIPTGKVISQCEGITNSQEQKWKEKKEYKWINGEKTEVGTTVQLVGDLLNTLCKMAIKRGYVGGIIMAVGASDFFTQDIDDKDELPKFTPKNMHAPTNNQPSPQDGTPGRVQGYLIPFGKYNKRSLEEVGPKDLANYVAYLEASAEKQGKAMGGAVLDFIERASEFIASFENDPNTFRSSEDDIPL